MTSVVGVLLLLGGYNGGNPSEGIVVDSDAVSWSATFSVGGAGQVRVYLPEDIHRGDVISGSVVHIPNGNSPAEREKNSGVLAGCVLSVEGAKQTGDQGAFSIPRIASTFGAALSLVLKDPQGKEIGTVECPIDPGVVVNPWIDFEIPRVGQLGRPMEVNGVFDGDCTNTKASFDAVSVSVIAESPRGCLVLLPSSTVGLGDFEVTEGNHSKSAPCNNLSVRLTANRTTLLQGEHSEVSVTVKGFEGMRPSDFPVPCEISNETPNIIQIPELEGRIRCFAIEHKAVQNGVWNYRMNARAIATGSYLIRGILFSVTVHQIKKNLLAEELDSLLRGIMAANRAEIDKINKEEQEAVAKNKKWPNSPEESGRSKKRDLLKATNDKLADCLGASNTELDAVKAQADKALADQTVVQLGASLVGFALEMLGYTDLPLPGVGEVLKLVKGAKVLAKGKKTLEALEKAEKALEAYEKLDDVKEKAEKLKKLEEAKELLDQTKKALEGEGK